MLSFTSLAMEEPSTTVRLELNLILDGPAQTGFDSTYDDRTTIKFSQRHGLSAFFFFFFL